MQNFFTLHFTNAHRGFSSSLHVDDKYSIEFCIIYFVESYMSSSAFTTNSA